MEAMALSRLQWIADIRGAFPPEQCGFRAHRSTADCLAAVVGTLEQASRDGHAAYLLLLHVQSAFYSLPHATIISAVRALGVQGGLLAYIRAFLSDRTSAVRVGQAISSHRPVTCGVPQGSVLSPFLFNLALAPISECVRNTGHLLVRAVVYADDVALFVRGPPSAMAEMRLHLQAAVDAVGKFLRAIGLCLSATKSEELMVHPRATTRLHTGRVIIDGVCLPWRPIVRYLGLTIDHRLTWSPAVKRLRAIMRRVEAAVRALLREAMAAPSPSHRVFTLRSRSPVSCTRCRCVACDQASGDTTASTIDESFPISALSATSSASLVPRVPAPSCPASANSLSLEWGNCSSFMTALWSTPLPPLQPPNKRVPLRVCLYLPGVRSKRRTPHCAVVQEAAARIQDDLVGRAHLYTDGSVRQDGSAAAAAAACVVPQLDVARQCRLSYRASSTTAELAGHHLAADIIEEMSFLNRVAILFQSRAALHQLLLDERAPPLDQRVACRLHTLQQQGCDRRLQWIPSHVVACTSCGEPETTEHLLLACPAYLQQRGPLLQELRRLDLPYGKEEDLLFPSQHHLSALRGVVEYLDSSELSARL
ncbi:uncharacterized protein LOC119444281 [Dermacentor silvarum]|uniref:uncharacterized protein LOC119444281 n=1 Tax=Dermacentor silvarum TaxID=543639 RepID=UPI001898515D|nr:uncharacterized protein LOC119444281 [Dermacentor silvarum]